MLGTSPKNTYVLLKYLGGMYHHMREKVMLLKPKMVDKAYVQAQYLENIGLKRAQSSRLKQKEKQGDSKDGKQKKNGGKYKNKIATHTLVQRS